MKHLSILLLTLMTSCQNEASIASKPEISIDFFEQELIMSSEEPILNIYCQFDECGEWGGHEEYIRVLKKGRTSFKLEYEKYSANCDNKVQVFDGLGYLIQAQKSLVQTKEIELKDKEKQAILDFSFEMVKSKFKEDFIGHAGIILSITNSDSTLFISTYSREVEHYIELIDKLNLDK